MSVSDLDGDRFGAFDMDGAGAAPAVPAAAPPSADPARTGWPCPRAPNGRVLPLDLSRLDENALLRAGGKAALYAVGTGPGDFHPEREPLILVHGIDGDPKNLAEVANRFAADGRHQVYVLCYDDRGRRTGLNGGDLAEEMRALEQRVLGPGRPATIVAHSMGGIVAREALNQLAAGPGRGAEKFSRLHLVAVDTPWHGYDGPSDRGLDAVLIGLARPFLPDGLEDMRARSTLFERLYATELPDNVGVTLVFADHGAEIEDYTEGHLAPLAKALVGLYCRDEPVRGDPQLMNFWHALLSSDRYASFSSEMRDRADAGRLDEAAVRAALARFFPRFPGDHTGVLSGRPFLDWLAAAVDRP
jgi:pimeloyl-ACP methyl ester carboxylesterase